MMDEPQLETVTESGYALQVLLVSRDEGLIEEIVTQLGAESVVITNDIDSARQKLGYLDCAVLICDIDTAPVLNRAVALRETSPTLVVVAVCDKALVGDLMASPVSNLVYRITTKPLGTGQFNLLLNSAYAEHEQLRRRIAEGEDITVTVAEDKPSPSPAILQDRRHFAVAGGLLVFLVGIIVFWLMPNGQDDLEFDEGTQIAADQPDTVAPAVLSQIAQINELLALAQSAATNGEFIKPDEASAVYYYNRVLGLDPYDGDALAGLNDVTDKLISRAESFMEDGNTVAARSDLDAVTAIRPMHPQLAGALAALEQKQIDISESAREQAQATLATEAELAALRAATEAREREQSLLRDLDAAISAGNVVSLREGSAIQLLNEAWSLSESPSPQVVARAQQLASLIIEAANTALDESDLRLAESLATQLANLPQAFIPGRQALDRSVEDALRLANAVIEPARRTRIVQPRYPRNASRRGIEGWVHLTFNITPTGDVSDIEIIEQTPGETFEDAARTAVSKWKYRPRTIDGVPSQETMEVRLQFQL